ncbi:hypothetical protein FACS1894199_04860 [Bacteroidia bacterium]|nr:hypothetical protein FACS1894199_04860 [Bacteroidia bacterium]
MTTMKITFDNPALMPMLETLVNNLNGVKKVTVSYNDVFAPDQPNTETQRAIEELRAGNGSRCKNVTELFEQLNS